ncbi:MAG: site-specific DNA-methyltransferase [Nitrospira sp.]|nr:site-specific DNA-methyltransferase [Nitrospira sp.]MDD9859850.1 site-specific DNA-methyltransferase [Nitrospira sp.]
MANRKARKATVPGTQSRRPTAEKTDKRPIESYAHKGGRRANNPPVGLVTPQTDPDAGKKKTWAYDPNIAPALQWAGKAERTSFEVPTVSLHVHERIESRTIIEAVRKTNGTSPQLPLFASPEENPPLREAVEFYKHRHNWSNRLIAGDSLLVMNSLLEKEGMAGKVQCVYMDPPYGIKYGSNFQPFFNNREVKDGKDEDLTREPEMIRAFRDTWELGVHSYLSYLRDRLLLVRELLSESGSCFVQIGDENVHLVGVVMDEIFGAENRLATISFATTSGSSTAHLPQVAHYLLWYAKDKKKAKYHQLYEPLTRAEIVEYFSWHVMVELPDGTCRKPTAKERFDPDTWLPEGARLYRRLGLDSQGESTTGRSEPYEWNGRVFHCADKRHWSISKEGLDRLAELGRLQALEEQTALGWKRYEEEVPGRRISNIWPAQMAPREKSYVVETATQVIQRCILMTTDPGDLVLDPTCGSGTTAFVAEQWGRRWITCDTSRVAIAIARQRLMTSVFSYYQLAHPEQGVGSGFQYRTVATVSPKLLAGNEPPAEETLYDQPLKDTTKARVTGPFTVEAVPAPTVKSIADLLDEPGVDPVPADNSIARSGETLRQKEWCDELEKSGVRKKSGKREKDKQGISFSRVELFPGRYLHADAETHPGAGTVGESSTAYEPQRAVICFGPEHAPLEQRQVERAWEEARSLAPKPDMLIFAAFQFDPEAAKDIDELSPDKAGMTLRKVQMNADLQNEDLRKKQRNSDTFWLVGQPDVELRQIRQGEHAGKWQVVVRGFDYFDTRSGELISGEVSESGKLESGDRNRDQIAMWMLDPDYDGRSLYPKQVFFPMSSAKEDAKDGWSKLAKDLKAEIDKDLIEAYRGVESLPFEAGEHKRVAVKIVDNRGVESLRILEIER